MSFYKITKAPNRSMIFKYTEKKLARDIGKIATLIDASLQPTYLPDTREVTLTHVGESEVAHTIFLGNLFLKISELPRKDRPMSIETFLRDVLTQNVLPPEELMASLSLRVRTDFEVDFRNRHLKLMGHDPTPSISFYRGDLLIEVVSDNDESVSTLTSDDLSESGISAEEAISMASAKMRRCTDENQWENLSKSIWISRYQDDYDFARLVAAEGCVKLPFDESPIVFAPSHSICLVTNKENAETITKMVEFGNEASSSHRPFSQQLWTLVQENMWEEWRPKISGDVLEVANLQAIRELSKKYEETKDYFERALEGDVFVAKYTSIQNEDGLVSYCVYTLDLPSYLPLTDLVAIVDPELPEDESLIGQVSWKEFVSCCEIVEDVSPIWYQVFNPLDAGEKIRLRELARPFN